MAHQFVNGTWGGLECNFMKNMLEEGWRSMGLPRGHTKGLITNPCVESNFIPPAVWSILGDAP